MIGGVIIKQIIVRLDDEIHQELKIKTIRDGVSIQSLIQEVVELYVKKDITSSELLKRINQ